MSRCNRRKFLKTALLGVGGFTLSTLPVKGHLLFSTPSSNNNEEKRLLLNEARQAFCCREYYRAEILYKQFIQLYPDDISGYDGLSKVYKCLGKITETVELYKSALNQNKSNPVFYDRLAKSMNTMSLGNAKQEKAYMNTSGETFLLGVSALLYLQAIQLAPDKKYLYEGLLDTTRCLEKKNKQLRHFNEPELSFSNELSSNMSAVTSLYAENWKESRSSLPRGKTTNNLTLSLNKIKEKKRRELHFEDERRCREGSISKKKKEFIYPYFTKSVKENQPEDMENYFTQINEISPSDTQSKHLLTKRYKKNKDYRRLIDFRIREVSNTTGWNDANPFWLKIRLAQALMLNAQASGNKQQIEEALTAYRQAVQQIDGENRNLKALGALYGGMAQCYFAQSAFGKGKETIIEGLEQTPHTSGIAHSLLINYAEGRAAENAPEEAEAILLRLSENDTKKDITNKFIASYIKDRESETQWRKDNNMDQWRKEQKERKKKNKEKQGRFSKESSPDKLKSSYALAKVYEKRNKHTQYNDVLKYIEKENKENEFVRKRKKNNS
ncbi:MAG: hypothetical protein LBI82_05210 [Dysgonamonadaceae bacterium]|jgi:predicted Zn-dependent protease|nr:hypothetical protein [Dysgonamonadaceae bacterium]